MKDKVIVNPSNYIESIKGKEGKVYLFKPGEYLLEETLVISTKTMLTALDPNNKPTIEIRKTENRPAIHIITDDCVISNINFTDKSMSNDIVRNDGHRSKITNLHIEGCRTAIISGGDDTTIAWNSINRFTQDGIQFSGSRTKIISNVIQDLIQLPSDDAHHHDAIQAWAGDPASPLNAKDRYLAKYELKDAEIVGNIIISTTDLDREYQGALQGITAFDGWMSGWLIEGNFINTHSTIHGITILGSIDSKRNRFRIYNNEVYRQCGEEEPAIHIKPARVWDGKCWTDIDQLSFNNDIRKVVDYNIADRDNSCCVHRHYENKKV